MARGDAACCVHAQGSAGSVLHDEAKKPLDASDVNTPRGVSAKAEVARLRKLLSENYESVSQLLFSHLLSSPRNEEGSGAGRSEETDAAPHFVENDMLDSAGLLNSVTNIHRISIPWVQCAAGLPDSTKCACTDACLHIACGR
jgi:hypothetical protein